jgi:CBS domain containing-hemolysin-like protein
MFDSTYYFFQFGLLVLLLCFSAFFSASEMAFSSLNRIKIRNLAVKNRKARLVLIMLDKYDKFLSSVLIGNNFVNIASSALATALLINYFGAKGVSLATLMMTLLILIFGEISPKSLARKSPELTAMRTAPFMRFLIFILTPLNFFASVWQNLVIKIFPVKIDRSTTEDELLSFVEEVRQEGGINIHEEQMIRQVIEFDDLRVSRIFTPRIDVAAVSQASTIDEIDKKFIDTGFSRLPVFLDTVDNITGIIIFKDFYHEVMKGLKTPAQIVKPVVYVNKTIKIAKLLKTMQGKKAHLAVVVDEYGGTLGIVTIEDIVEELVGEIWDEHDEVVEPVKKENDGSFTALGNVNFLVMLEMVTEGNMQNIGEIPDTTIANWVIETFGRLPHTNEMLTWNFLIIIVSKVLRNRIMEVKIYLDKTKIKKKGDGI